MGRAVEALLVLPPDEYCDAAFPGQFVVCEILDVSADDDVEGSEE